MVKPDTTDGVAVALAVARSREKGISYGHARPVFHRQGGRRPYADRPARQCVHARDAQGARRLHPRSALRPGRPRPRDHGARRQALLRRREHQHAPRVGRGVQILLLPPRQRDAPPARAHAEARHRGAERERDGGRARDRPRLRPPGRTRGAVQDRASRGDAGRPAGNRGHAASPARDWGRRSRWSSSRKGTA